jgi:hypothetical protein
MSTVNPSTGPTSPSDPAAESSLPIACTLTDAELRDRDPKLTTLFDRATRVRELPDGYAFAFPPADAGVRDLLDLVLAERACCAFLSFDLVFPTPHDAVWLHLRGGEEVKEFVRGTFLLRVPTDAAR